MSLLDSRRLTGPSPWLPGSGALIEVRPPADPEPALAAWRRAVGRLLEAVGWEGVELRMHLSGRTASLALSAPPDLLDVAVELNELAWRAAEAELSGSGGVDLTEGAARLRRGIAADRRPALPALQAAARARGLTFLSDDDLVSVGSGFGVRTWPIEELPEPDAVDWDGVADVPIVLVTGSNGKTTVVRLMGAMVAAAGWTPGYTCTDGVFVGGAEIEEGDFAGPGGARTLLRRPEVEVAVLETARGGILRRGLAVERADGAVVTNVSEDHLGDFGVEDLRTLAAVKLTVARVVGPGGWVVLNAEDPWLVEGSAGLVAPVIWFALDPANPVLQRHLAAGGRACLVEDDRLVLAVGAARTPVVGVGELPMALGGRARYNVANALAALAAGLGLGIPVPALAAALREFGRRPGDNPGRLTVLEVGGARIVVDYVHNPPGMAAVAALLAALPAQRRLLLVGMAGDRTDAAIRDLARAAWALRPDRVVVKEAEAYRRGRRPGEVPELLADEFRRLGLAPEDLELRGGELEAVRAALAWARQGDLLMLAIHEERETVLTLLERLVATGWRAGDPLPD